MFQIKIDKNSEMRGHTKSSVFFFLRSIKQFPANVTNNEPVFNVSIPLLYLESQRLKR